MLENKLIPLGLDSGGFNLVQRDQLSSDSDLSPDENALSKAKPKLEETSFSSDPETELEKLGKRLRERGANSKRQITMQAMSGDKVYTQNISNINEIITKTEKDIIDMRSIINDRIFELAKSGEDNFDNFDPDNKLPDINLSELMLSDKQNDAHQSIDSMRSNFEMLISKNIARTKQAAINLKNAIPSSSEGGP